MTIPTTIVIEANNLKKATELVAWLNSTPAWYEMSDHMYDDISCEIDSLLPDFEHYLADERFCSYHRAVENGKLYLDLLVGSDDQKLSIGHRIEYVAK